MPSSRVLALATSLLLATVAGGCAAGGTRVVAGEAAAAAGHERAEPEPTEAARQATTTTSPAPSTTAPAVVASAPTPTAPPETSPPTSPPTTLAPEPVPAPEPAPEPEPEPAPAPAPEPPASPAGSGSLAPAGTGFDGAAEWDFFSRTNAERSRIGVGALRRDGSLDAYAREHAVQMMNAGRIYHSEIGVLLGGWWTVGENVGVGPAVAPIHQALLDSPPHYANISHSPFTAMGVGVVADAQGRIWTVHVYGA